ncbi:MAG: MFS transporter [Dehalococcoidia bacterium]|nr:MFS transporter [Dehalococcoidia bacterium]
MADKTTKGFYGWTALSGAMLVYFTTIGTFFYSYGVFLPFMCNQYDWSRVMVGAGLSIALLAFGLPGPLIGASIARFGPRINIIFGNLLVAIGLACMSIATEIWQLYLFYGVFIGLGAGFGLYMTCTTVANNWFVKKRSLAMGLVTAAGGLGGLAFPLLITALISSIGWQMSWLVLASIQLVLTVVIGGIILVRNSPEDMGQVPDNMPMSQSSLAVKAAGYASVGGASDWETKQAMRNPVVWLIAIMCSASFLALGTVISHQVAYLEDIGFSPIIAATTLSVVAGMSILGRLGFGLLGTKFDVRHLAIASCVGQFIALVILLTARSLFLIYVYAGLFGICYGALVVALPTFIGTYYGRSHYAQILGFIFPLTLIAEAAGPLMGGAIYDATGTYTLAFAIITGFSVVGLICAILARKPKLNT